MSRVDEFDAFYTSQASDVLKFLYAVTGDRTTARVATVDAFEHAWRDWDKIRDGDTLRYVRVEGWKAQAVERSTHPLRRRREDDADVELLEALVSLPSDDRRLLVLMTLGRVDLDAAAREIGVSDEEAIEQVTTAITGLEKATGQSIGELEGRLNALGDVVEGVELPDPARIRSRSTRGHRFNLIAVVAAAVLAVVLGSVVLTDGRPLSRLISDPYREQLGAESNDLILDAQKISAETLLTSSQVTTMTPAATWAEGDTVTDPDASSPLTACATERFATDDPLKVFARSFVSESGPNQRTVQSLEVARNVDAARAAYAEMVQWFAACPAPRLQLTESFLVARPYGDVLILRLVQQGDAPRTLTVGMSSSGTVATSVVHELDGLEGAPTIEDFAHTVNLSLQKVCRDSGGECSDAVQPVAVDPPAQATDPAFLAPIDLPMLPGVAGAWASTEPESTSNPAATTCDQADFGAAGATASARVFVVPEAEFRDSFGIVETVGVFGSTEAATAFVDQVQAAINGCPSENLAASVTSTEAFGDSPEFRGTTWTLTLQVENGTPVTVRTAIVQRGASVAQILFTPNGTIDMSESTFAFVAHRATQRLAYAAPPA